MLGKLLKYDVTYMIKNMIAFYAISLFSAIAIRILSIVPQTTIVNIFYGIFVGTMISMIISTIINTIIRSWARFRLSLYGDESYLSHTLPVTRAELFESKFIGSIIFTLAGFITGLVAVIIAFASKENFDLVKISLEEISTSLNMNVGLFLGILITLIFLEMLFMIQVGFIGIILGHKCAVKKKLFSFLFGFAVYGGAQIITTLYVIISSFFDNGIMIMLIKNEPISFNAFVGLLVGDVVVYVILLVAINIVSLNIFQKKLNIE